MLSSPIRIQPLFAWVPSSQPWTLLTMAAVLFQTGEVVLISVLPLAAPKPGCVFQVTPPVEGAPWPPPRVPQPSVPSIQEALTGCRVKVESTWLPPRVTFILSVTLLIIDPGGMLDRLNRSSARRAKPTPLSVLPAKIESQAPELLFGKSWATVVSASGSIVVVAASAASPVVIRTAPARQEAARASIASFMLFPPPNEPAGVAG